MRITATAQDARRRVIHARTWLWVTDERGGDLGTEYNGLSLLTDKRSYRPGETARALLNTDDVGQTVFLSVEGDRLYRTIAVAVTQHSTVVRVPVPTGYAPNVYLVASYVRNKRLVESDSPLRVSVPERDLLDRDPLGPVHLPAGRSDQVRRADDRRPGTSRVGRALVRRGRRGHLRTGRGRPDRTARGVLPAPLRRGPDAHLVCRGVPGGHEQGRGRDRRTETVSRHGVLGARRTDQR